MADSRTGGPEGLCGAGAGGLALLGLAPGAPSCPHGEVGGEETARAGWGCGAPPREGEGRRGPGALTGLTEVAAGAGGFSTALRVSEALLQLLSRLPLRGVVFYSSLG